MNTVTGKVITILEAFYLPEGIFLQNITNYSFEDGVMAAEFCVPQPIHQNTQEPLNYVTCEEYNHCLSQLSYACIGLLVMDGYPDLAFIDFTRFKQLMTDSKMRLRKILNLRYIKNVAKDSNFELTLRLLEVEIKKGFACLTVSVKGILRGKLEFAIPL